MGPSRQFNHTVQLPLTCCRSHIVSVGSAGAPAGRYHDADLDRIDCWEYDLNTTQMSLNP